MSVRMMSVRMICRVGIPICVCLLLVLGNSATGEPQKKKTKSQKAKEQQKKELTESRDMLQRLVNQGKASGLEDVYWDNRDNGHSTVNLKNFPKLKKVHYNPSEVKTRGWGLQGRVLENTTVGNSSTAHSDIRQGSQTRTAYTSPWMYDVLHRQYRGNNLYIYPEHRDHDPGNKRMLGKKYNGGEKKRTGYGDLMPTNTPYLITSQGSSGTDKPFISTVIRTIAAFRPDVRARLEKDGLLMPTVQMLLRSTNRQVKNWDDYFSGKAHPAVFDGKQLNPVAMVRAAQAMTLETIPPLVQLKVLEEVPQTPGRDYFAPRQFTELLGNTPSAIARIWRGVSNTRRMVVSAAESIDPIDRPLNFKWVVLRGNPENVQITKKDTRGSEVEIVIQFFHRQPALWDDDLWSNRLDIGVFATDGKAVSAPAFITWFTLDNEERTYDDKGRIQEIEYGTGRFVDPRLGANNTWKDVYHWDGSHLKGWTRFYKNGRKEVFSADGAVTEPQSDPVGEKNTEKRPDLTQPNPDITSKHSATPRSPIPSKDEIELWRTKLADKLTGSDRELLLEELKVNSPAARFVLLSAAIRKSAQQCDIQEVRIILSRLTDRFSSNLFPLRLELIGTLEKEALEKSQWSGIGHFALDSFTVAKQSGDLEAAKEFASAAIRTARRAQNPKLLRRATRAATTLAP